jgi:hypothetical protein
MVGAGFLLGSNTAWGGDPLERQAECIEDKTDDLHDLIDDDFERSPDYRFLCQTAGRLDQMAEDLDEKIEDQDFGCASGLAARIASQAHMLEGLISRQPVCHVSPRAIARASCLAREICGESGQLAATLQGVGSIPSGPVVDPGWPSGPIIQPYPVYRPSWPMRDPRFQRGWQSQRLWGTELQNRTDRDDWQRIPAEDAFRPDFDWNRDGNSGNFLRRGGAF